MSNYYGISPIELSTGKTISLFSRNSKTHADEFASQYTPGSGIRGLLDSLPHFLAADGFRAVLKAIRKARDSNKPILWGIGGHVVKCGLAPVLIQLMQNGFASGFAMNGATSIHDFEIALAGHTSEEVEAGLPDGSFGTAEETGREWNKALLNDAGAGESLGLVLDALANPLYAEKSLLLEAWRRKVPVTVHIAIGTDTTHAHPAMDPAMLGIATYKDFLLFATLVARLDQGGVYLNVGSAVIMPEVFLKALSSVRNLGHRVEAFTTVNFDALQHYRPRINVLQRPHTGPNSQGIGITGHHEIMIPLLAACLMEGLT